MHVLTKDLFDLRHSLGAPFLESVHFPWEVLIRMPEVFTELSSRLPTDFKEVTHQVWIGAGTYIAPGAFIQGPAIIGRNCQIRHAAFVREFVLAGDEVVIGNSTEVKNAILFDGVQAPHFNYIGDSILGYKVHMGAGAVLSNFKLAGDEIKVVLSNGEKMNSALKKLGALLGDYAEVGCNAVLFPGTVAGKNSVIYPLCPARGYIPAGHILKNDGKLYKKT